MIGTIGEVARVKQSDLPFYGQNMYLLRFDSKKIDIGYFLHFFDSKIMKDYFGSIKNNSSQGYLRANQIEDIKIPLPSIEEQKGIVLLLNQFQTIAFELTYGIPAEIQARRKQYEHFRNRLLTFKTMEVA